MATVEGSAHILRYVNPAFCRLLDRPADALVGKSFGEILPDEGDCIELLDRVFHSGQPANHIQPHDSRPQTLISSYSIWPVTAEQEPATSIIQVREASPLLAEAVAMNEALLLGSIRQHELTEAADTANSKLSEEIKERLQAEEALLRSEARLSDRAGQLEGLVSERTSQLSSSNQQLEAFVYTVAHDLRAPLRAMQGFAAMLLEEAGAGLTDRCRAYAVRIGKSAQFMDALLVDLLDFSRVSQQHIELSSVSLQTVVESVLAQLQQGIAEVGANVESAGPWPCVLAHEPTLTQVLVNLTSNALKFSVAGVSPQLRLWTQSRAEYIRMWVEDNGIGIEPAYQEQIFRLFTRLGGERYAGTGVGLAIVQTGVQRMGGRIGVESTLHQGSRFWFELRQAPGNSVENS
jgi:signal transduction histidine kinase